MKFILAIVGSILSADLLAGSLVGVRNPVMWADVPDPSLCSDGEKFYLVSTTMHLVPGVPVMESTDMVHWKTVSYVLPRFDTGKFFMGAKFALFNYATKEVGGLADFDYFRVDAPLHEVR